MEKGYQKFSRDLTLIFTKITTGYTSTLKPKYEHFKPIKMREQPVKIYIIMLIDFLRECTILQDYATLYTPDKYDVCSIFYVLEVRTQKYGSLHVIIDTFAVSRLYPG